MFFMQVFLLSQQFIVNTNIQNTYFLRNHKLKI